MGSAAVSTCRSCGSPLDPPFLDLGAVPLVQSFVPAAEPWRGEPIYPLRVAVCEACWLVQLDTDVPREEIFHSAYPYFSSFSTSWLEHARSYAATMVDRLHLCSDDLVLEVGSNDGYLLRWFAERGVRVQGIDPSQSVARAAAARGIPTRVDFFGKSVGAAVRAEVGPAALVVANNVLAHTPDPNDLVGGMAAVLADTGTLTIEFPHLAELIAGTEFDTIYHEHYSYLSLTAVEHLLARHGLTVVDVDHLPTHGGSLRIHARHAAGDLTVGPAVAALRDRELRTGVASTAYYEGFADRVHRVKADLMRWLFDQRLQGRSVAGYGAPGKGTILLNHCGIRRDLLPYTVDRNPARQGMLMPGSRIPVHAPEYLAEMRPDVILVLPWNLRDEIVAQLAGTCDWQPEVWVPIPRLERVA